MNYNKRNQGMAFALTMVVLFIALTILLLGMMAPNASLNTGLLGMTSNSSRFASNNVNATQAFDLAESGVEYTIEWLHTLSAPPTNTTEFAPAIWGSSPQGSPARSVISLAGGTFSVEVYPNSQNTGQSQKTFLVESIGTYNGFSEMVVAHVAQTSFGKYAYFNDLGSQDGYWITGINSFDGPYHSNNCNSSGTPGQVPDNILWYQNAADVMFNYDAPDAYTCVSPTISWNLNSVGNMVPPSSASDWNDIALGGQSSIGTGQSDIPLPTSSNIEMNAALGTATAPSGSTKQVLVPTSGGVASGGIYINGDVSEMAFSTNSAGNVQTITITQADNPTNPTVVTVTTVTENPTTNQTTVSVAVTPNGGSTTTTTTSTSGLPNGAIYVNGNVGINTGGSPPDATDAWNQGNYYYGTSKTGGVHGVIADNYYSANGNLTHASGVTIATNASDNLNFDGSLTTNTKRETQNGVYVPESEDPNYLKYSGTIGVVSDNIEVVDNSYTGQPLTNMEIDGAVLAYNTFDATNIYGRGLGNFTVMGGYIAKQGGYFGVMDWNGNMINGFAEHYHYDARLADNPPPFFPTTGSNYDIVSWTRVNSSSSLMQ
jgi:hypothetical protein